MRQVAHIMGMAISVDIPGCEDKIIFEKVFKRLKLIDQRFSPYKKDNELAQYRSGRTMEENLSPEFKEIIEGCKAAEKDTDGFFSALFSREFNPSGYVKGWAISKAGDLIDSSGFKTYCIGAGGDIMARSSGSKTWNIGIQDPYDKQSILKKLRITNGAVATSGNYERGGHIINPKTGMPPGKFSSVTVWGPDILVADVLATAIFAAESPRLMNGREQYHALAVPREIISPNMP